MEDTSPTTRIRLVFEDHRNILKKCLRKEGLKRSWLILKPQHDTVSDLASHILHVFDLHNACPNGLVLSMDNFVLPPFESTSILKDKDIVLVKKKGGNSIGTNLRDGVEFPPRVEALENQPPGNTGLKLLANEEFEKETGGYEGKTDEDEEKDADKMLDEATTSEGNAISKKRKASKSIQSPKKKKGKFVREEESPTLIEGTASLDHLAEEKQSFSDSRAVVKETPNEKDNSTEKNHKSEKSSKTAHTERSQQVSKSKYQENDDGSIDATPASNDVKKLPSRNARRKQAKRRWLRELRNIGKKTEVNERKGDPRKNGLQFSDKLDKKLGNRHQQKNQSPKLPEVNPPLHCDKEAVDDVVPVVIKPGHIRFQPLGEDADQAIVSSQAPLESFHWNGITNKRKGQKWGKEKASAPKNNAYEGLTQESSQVSTIEDKLPVSDFIDFSKLAPYGPFPEEGDTVAYRVIELSSTWTPELSSFRVGKIAAYNEKNNKIKLVSVPEHPLDLENVDKSLYGGDGSLEVDFSSLVDVRIVKHGKSASVEPAVGIVDSVELAAAKVNGDSAKDPSIAVDGGDNNVKDSAGSLPQDNGQLDVWEQVIQAINAKKAQLSQEDDQTSKQSSGRSRPYRAMRGGALGPTMALLRAQNTL